MPVWAQVRVVCAATCVAVLFAAALLDPHTSRAAGQPASRQEVAGVAVPAGSLPTGSNSPDTLRPEGGQSESVRPGTTPADPVPRVVATRAAGRRTLSPFYYYTKHYEGALWSHPGDIRSHLRFDLAHHGFSDVELRGLSPLQMERLHSAHHHGLVAPGQKPADTSLPKPTPRDAALGFRFRGCTWLLEGSYAEALADYQEALRLDPDNALVHSSLGWFYAACPDAAYRDGKRAVEFARRACESSNYTAWYQLNTLAAAHAEAGDLEVAQHWARQALERAPEDEKSGCEQRLQLYVSGQPLRPRS